MAERISNWALELDLTNALKELNPKQVANVLLLMKRYKYPKSKLKRIMSDYLYTEEIDKILKKY